MSRAVPRLHQTVSRDGNRIDRRCSINACRSQPNVQEILLEPGLLIERHVTPGANVRSMRALPSLNPFRVICGFEDAAASSASLTVWAALPEVKPPPVTRARL